jgi:hypothetical protein
LTSGQPSRPEGFASGRSPSRLARSPRSSVTPRNADFVAFVVVSQLMWIGGTRPWSTAAQIFGRISLSSVRSWRTGMPVASENGWETPWLRLSTQTPPQARTISSCGLSWASAPWNFRI